MGRVAFCLTGSLAFSISLFACASEGSAASAGHAGFGGHGARFRSVAPGFHRAHRGGRFHRTWFARSHHNRFADDGSLLFGAAGLGDYGYGDGTGPGPGPGYGPVPVFAGPPPFLAARGAPPSPPAVYVIHAGGTAPYGRVSKGHHPGPRILSGHLPPAGPGRDRIDAADGPRIIHVTVPRGL